jgi:hypothetical protein
MSVTVNHNLDNMLVLVAGCAAGSDDECDFASPRDVQFGSRQMSPAGRASSDSSGSVTTAGIWYLSDADLDSACNQSYPCTRTVKFELDENPSSLIVGTMLLFNARQAAPETFTADGGDPCGSGLLTSTTIRTSGAMAIDIGAVASSAAFGRPGQGQVKRLERIGCGNAGAQATTKLGAPVGPTAMDLLHPSPTRCSHAVAVFAAR